MEDLFGQVHAAESPDEEPENSFYRRAIAELDAAVERGLMHIAAYDPYGYPMYALTDEGRRKVEAASTRPPAGRLHDALRRIGEA